MKFGKILLKNQILEWSRGYISYKVLKKLINNAVKKSNSQGGTVDDDTVIVFLFAVDRELEKVNDFFLKKSDQIERRLRDLTEKYRHFYIPNNNSNSPSINFDSSPNFDPYTDEELLSALSEIKDQIHKLGHFTDINKKGFIKILKKFDKRLGREDKVPYLETKVNILPFASSSWFNEMLDSIEHWIQEINNRYNQNFYQNIEFTTKARLRQINLTEEQNKMMMNSIYNDDTDILKILINPDSSNLNIKNPIKKTLTSMLYKACHFRAMKCVKLLLHSGASIIDNDDINGRSLIHHLVINNGKLPRDTSPGSPTTSNMMSTEGLQMTYFTTAFLTQKNSKSDDGKFEDTSLISWILENIPQTEHSKISFRDAFGRSPLHYAAIKGFEKLSQILLEFLIKTGQFSLQQGFNDPSWFDNDGFTPLLYAVLRGHTTVVNCIIKVAKIKNVDASSNAADFYPAVNSTINQHITPYSISHSHTQTPLAIACKFGHITTAKLLLAYGADPDIQDEDGETSVHLAARGGFEGCVRLLVGLDVVVEVPDDIKNIINSSKLKKANIGIKENFYGWTPLFLAVVEGHAECVKGLIQAGANPNVTDNSGWTPHMHAVFRGYSHSAVKDILRPLTIFEEPSRSPSADISTKSKNKRNASAEFAYGHKYLQDQSLILVTLGNTDTRKGVDPVELYNTQISSLSIVPSTSISLVVDAKNATGEPAIVDLPVNTTDSIMFYSSNIEEVLLIFDIVPTYRTKRQLIGRATALLSSVKTSHSNSLISSITVPILDMNLEVIGRVVFEVLIIKPFKHKNLDVSKRTYWKSVTTKVIGHRGLGMNRETPTGHLQLGENTLISFITAASLGAEYIEFDVQLTKDHIPVIYHDWTITETQYDIPVCAITLQQFLNLKKKGTGIKGQQVEKLLDRNFYKEFQNGTNQQKDRKVKRSNSLGPVDTLTCLVKKEGKLKGNSEGTIQAPFTTLVETFKKLDVHIGFNIEVKYPMVDEAEGDGLQPYHTELNLFVDSILKCVFDHAQSRSIIFSSFHPDICLMLAFKQPNYPVFFLTDCGEVKMADARCNSLQEAIRFAKFADLLGIVATSAVIIEAPKLVTTIKETGLLLFSYGTLNNDVNNVRLQKRIGVDAVIVDSVLAVRKGLQQND